MFTGRMPGSGKLPVLFLLTGQKSGFSPRRGDTLHRFRSNFAGPTATWVRLAVQNFTSIAPGGGNAAPKISKISTYSLDRFSKLLGAFIRLTILHLSFKFRVIRITGYGVIAEKPRVGKLGQIFLCTL